MALYSVQRAKHTTGTSFTITVATTTQGAVATNEVQTVTASGNGGVAPTGGTFTITFNGQTTSALAYNADGPTTVQTAFRALSSVGAGNATVTGTAIATGYTITFIGTLAATNVAACTASGASLTGSPNDIITLTGCPTGVIQVSNRATSGNPIYFKLFSGNDTSTDGITELADDTYVVPFGTTKQVANSLGTRKVKVVGPTTQAYSVEAIDGLN